VNVIGYCHSELNYSECQHARFNMGEGIGFNAGIVLAEKWWSLLPTVVNANVSTYRRCGRIGRGVIVEA